MVYAPIVIFAFNRIDSLAACIKALQANTESSLSDLIIYVDGPRKDRQGEVEKVDAVRAFVKKITGFRSLTYHFSDANKKLGPSIISGVTEVINQYGSAIVLEDDLICGRNFLSFINQALALYQNCPEVFSVCGYTNIVQIPKDYSYDAYYCPRSSSWGWATWKDRWDSCDWELNHWDEVKKNANAFNKWGGSDCYGMLYDWKRGRNQSWAIRFCYSQFVQGKVSLFPVISHIDNEGFDGSGTNCKKWSRYKFIMDLSDNKNFRFPQKVIKNEKILQEFLRYYSIPMRAYSRIMYIIYDIKSLLNR